jgi:hypothetical protein
MNKFIIFCLPFVLILSGCGIGSYEGMNAKEWADEAGFWEDEYDSFRSCVEDYDGIDWEEKKDWGGVFYYCE